MVQRADDALLGSRTATGTKEFPFLLVLCAIDLNQASKNNNNNNTNTQTTTPTATTTKQKQNSNNKQTKQKQNNKQASKQTNNKQKTTKNNNNKKPQQKTKKPPLGQGPCKIDSTLCKICWSQNKAEDVNVRMSTVNVPGVPLTLSLPWGRCVTS